MSKTYPVSLYQYIHDVEPEHFWFVARNEMLSALLSRFIPNPKHKTFLDIGCGTGVMLSTLERLGFAVTGLDVNARALTYAAQKTNCTLLRTSIFQYHATKPFHALGAFDLMEHIGDDAGFLVRCRTLLAPKGYLFLTVPAEPYLWSSVDRLSGHKRRYTKDGLRAVLQKAGFRIVDLRYWNSLLLPVYILWRRIEGNDRVDALQRYLTKPHPVVNNILLAILRLEQVLGRERLPFGATLVAIAKKV